MSLEPAEPNQPAMPAASDALEAVGVSEAGSILAGTPVPQLESRFPEMSARHLKTSTLVRWGSALTAIIVLAGALAPPLVADALAFTVAFAFLSIALLRFAGIFEVLAPADGGEIGEAKAGGRGGPENALPGYAVLVALYDEAPVIGQVLDALNGLDYPKDRLQISLIVEADDRETRDALARHTLASHMRVVVVPDGMPRTKPRALNHALASAVGDYVVVYDAEDVPAPDQLRRALAIMEADPERTGCVQSRLDIYNPHASFFTRQFSIEYGALFRAILPVLERFGLPVPLGGTSNHFPRWILERAGGWDAFNVTEDADLGIRLARHGYRVRMLASTTWEEAPPTFRIWLHQRTRWLKGWMQTYLVHMRRPASLWRDLGAFRFLGFQVLMGGMILSALVHPWFYIGLCYAVATQGGLPFANASQASNWLLALAAFNLLAGYVSAMLLGALAVGERHDRAVRGRTAHLALAWSAFAMPIYWLMISFAGYRALWQLATSPFVWEKTPHTGRNTSWGRGEWRADSSTNRRRPRV